MLTKLLYNVPKAISHCFTAYHLYYKKNLEIILTKSTHKPFFLWAPSKLLLLSALFDYITKFVIYHLHYKEKLGIIRFVYNLCPLYSNKPVSNRTWTSVCTVSCLCFRYSLGRLDNLLKVFLFTYNGGACGIEPGLVNKKRKSLKTFLYCFFDALQPFSLFLSWTLLKLYPAIFKYFLMFICLAMSKYAAMSE